MSMRIIRPGVLTTVQDGGRSGYMKSGIGTNGAMDQDAYRAANEIVGNPEGEAVLEMTLQGINAVFTENTVIALTGADMDAHLDGVRLPRYEAVPVMAGQRLEMGMAANGLRAYLAVQGGFAVPVVMGSRSTNLKCHFGGFEGRALQAGDELPTGTHRAPSLPSQRKWKAPHYNSNITVRVVPGPQAEYFTDRGWETFLTTRYEVSQQSDRMGIRLIGPAIESAHGVDIVSDGITFGSIQIPKSGTPIILMADHQTTGGYAKIGTVVSFDLPLLAQAAPGSFVSFRKISVEEAQDLLLHPEKRNRAPELHVIGHKNGTGGDRSHSGWRKRTAGKAHTRENRGAGKLRTGWR